MKFQNQLASSELADTGLWHLIVLIGSYGMQAWLKMTENQEANLSLLFDTKWETCDSADLLRNIESAVYDNPRVLDDFSADIILQTDKALWFPKSLEEGTSPEILTETFGSIFTNESDDCFIDSYGKMECVYSLTPGISSFLQRTFPGVRMWCHQTILLNHISDNAIDNNIIFIDLSNNTVTIAGLSNKNLLFISTKADMADNDILFHIFTAMKAYSIKPEQTQIIISAPKDRRKTLTEVLQRINIFVMPASLPTTDSDSEIIPLPIILCANRINKR